MECLTKFYVCLFYVMVTLHGAKSALLEECANDAACRVETGDPNAVCSTDVDMGGDTNGNCICTGAYKNNGDNTGCVAKVLDDACEGDSDCTGTANSVCSTEKKCECGANYIKDGAACKKVLGDTCADDSDCTDSVDNSVCSTEKKCECDDNYSEESAACKKAAGSSATSAWMTTSLIVTSMLIYLPRLI